MLTTNKTLVFESNLPAQAVVQSEDLNISQVDEKI